MKSDCSKNWKPQIIFTLNLIIASKIWKSMSTAPVNPCQLSRNWPIQADPTFIRGILGFLPGGKKLITISSSFQKKKKWSQEGGTEVAEGRWALSSYLPSIMLSILVKAVTYSHTQLQSPLSMYSGSTETLPTTTNLNNRRRRSTVVTGPLGGSGHDIDRRQHNGNKQSNQTTEQEK